MNKNTVFNNGLPISFELIKQNREKAIKEISEGNTGLEQLMNTCIDLNIETYASCGDDDPYISFIYNDNTKKFLINLIKIISSLGYRSKKYYDLSIINTLDNIIVSIYINSKNIDTSSFFFFIDDLIHKIDKTNFDPKTDNIIIMDLMIKLKMIFPNSTININLSDRISKEYPYILVIDDINDDNFEIAKNILSFTNQTIIYGKKCYRINCRNFHEIILIYNYLNNKKHSVLKR